VNSDYKIELASWVDLGPLQKIEKVCFEEDAWPLWDLIGVLTLPGISRFKAKTSLEMVGFIAGEIKRPENAGWITTLGVLPDYRRNGVASALLAACEQHMAMPVVRLCVRLSNVSAQKLYLREGYRQVDIWEKYYYGGESALVMEKDRREKGG
jgi:ribosomal-protein-alanine N-acetyltransferase